MKPGITRFASHTPPAFHRDSRPLYNSNEVGERQPSAYALAIREHRQAQGVSLAELSERTGMTRSALSRIESGLNVNPTVGTLRRTKDGDTSTESPGLVA